MSPADLWSTPLVIHTPEDARPGDLDAFISVIAADRVRAASSLVLIVSHSLQESLASTAGIQSIRDRVPTLPVLVLWYDLNELSHRIRGLDFELDSPDADAGIRLIRSYDVIELANEYSDHCFFKATPHYHFVAPSGNHCATFVRIGDAVRSKIALDNFAFWLLPTVASADVVLADSWSISAIVLRALQRVRSEAYFECLSAHPAFDPISARSVLAVAASHLAANGRLAFISSVGSSGLLESLTANLLSELRPKGATVRFTTIMSIGRPSAHGETICVLPSDERVFDSAESCEFCRSKSEALRIDPALYYVKDSKERGVLLQLVHFEPAKTTVQDLGGTPGVLSVHRDGTNDTTHHAFHVDVHKLLSEGRFRAELVRLARREPIDLILTPTHMAGRLLGSILASTSGADSIHVDSLDGLDIGSPAGRRLLESRRLLVADDAMITGSRMRRYNDVLRLKFGGFESVRFGVVIDRTESPSAWRAQRISLTKHAPWSASLDEPLAILHLPNWGPAECPWCREYEWLEHLCTSTDLLGSWGEWLENRMAKLTERQAGLHQEPLLRPPNVPSATIGRGALAGEELNEMQTLFAVCAALQGLRNDSEDRQLRPTYPVYQVFDPKNFANYTEGLIRGALLRCMQPRELGSRLQEGFAEHLKQCCGEREQAYTLTEAIAAAARGVIFRDIVLSLRGRLTTRSDGVAQLLA